MDLTNQLNILNSAEVKDGYQVADPFPHVIIGNFLDEGFARTVQEEILQIPDSEFDRYNNPFEQKDTLRDKNNLPPNVQKLYDGLQSQEFLDVLSEMVGHKLINDPTKNFWGIHRARDGDLLDIHVDAGCHPVTKQKKQVTLGIYMSKNWKEEYGGCLELWEGENSVNNKAKITECKSKVLPMFNTLVVFTCTDDSWHGSPEPVTMPDGDDAVRIFLTLSYLSDNEDYDNHRQKAFFVKRPQDPDDPEKDKLRLMRADPSLFSSVYRTE